MPTDRLKRPHAPDAERDILGCCLLDNECIGPIVETGLKVTDFYQPAHGTIFEHILALWNAGTPVDPVLLTDSLRKAGKLDEVGGLLAVATLEQNVFSTGAAPNLADIVIEKARVRRLMSLGEAIQLRAAEETGSTEIVEKAMRELLDVENREQKRGWKQIAACAPQLLERLDAARATGGMSPDGARTCLKDVDELIVEFAPGDLAIIAARPSVGKTSLALEIALRNAQRGIPVGMFSMEMTDEQLCLRLACSLANVSMSKARGGFLSGHEMLKIRHTLESLATLPLFVNDTVNLTVSRLRSQAVQLHSQTPIGMILVDYLQLLGVDRTRGAGGRSRNDEVNEQSRALKTLARELEVPVLALSQLSRRCEQEKRLPNLSDLRDSGGIEQDADTVIFLHREKDPAKSEREREAKAVYTPMAISVTTVIVSKNRNGPIGMKKVAFEPETQRWINYVQQGNEATA